LVMHLVRIGVDAEMSLKDVRRLLKENDIKCAQDTLRGAMKLLKNNSAAHAVVGSNETNLTTSRYTESGTRLDSRLDSSHPETTQRLAHVSPRLANSSHETDGTLSKERLVVDHPVDWIEDPEEDTGLF